MTFRELLTEGKNALTVCKIEDAELDAWLLLEHISHMNRAAFFLRQQENASQEDICRYRDLIRQRGSHIPVQHLTGTQEFMGLEFLVSPDVLVPRQDTELLVEKLLPLVSGKSILDVCTGSGCIAISLAKLGVPRRVDATDLSGKALDIAGKNAKKLEADVTFYQGDLLENISEKYDIIVSNPPYIASKVVRGLMPEVREHEPLLALDGGADGLVLYRRLLEQVPPHLETDGIFAVEIGYDQGETVTELFVQHGFEEIECCQDLCGNDRVVMGRLNKQ